MSSRLILGMSILLVVLVILIPFPARVEAPANHDIRLEARSFAFAPPVIHVNQGDRVHLELESMDVVHGFYLDGYDVQAVAEPGVSAHVAFTADKPGKYRFRCSVNCGSLHPFMIGELIVGPNTPFGRALGLTAVTAAGSVAYLWARSRQKSVSALPGGQTRV